MKKLLFLLILTSFLNAQQKLSSAKPFTPKDLLNLNRLSDPQISPDGKWLLFNQTTTNLETNTKNSDIWAYNLVTEQSPIQITFRPTNEYQARWINNGESIAFLSTSMNSPQIFTKKFPDGITKGLTAIVGGISSFRFSPDGTYIAYTADVKTDEDVIDLYPEMRSAKAYVYNDLPVRAWDHWEDKSKSHVFIMSSTGKGPKVDIMQGEKYDCPVPPFGGLDDYIWSSNSREIIYVSKKVDNPEQSTNTDLYVFNTETKETKNITSSNPGYDKHPVESPDGKFIAYTSQARPGFEADKVRLMLFEKALGTSKELLPTLDQWVSQFIWSPDSKTIYFSATNKGTEPLMKVDVATGKIETIADGMFNYSSGIDITNDGSKIVVGRTSMQRPVDFYSVNTNDNKVTQLTNANSLTTLRVKDIEVREKMVKASDGKEIHTFVLLPPDFDASKKYPMITYCQGGPQGTISNYWSYRWNLYLMASQGYVVCAPNRRGMPGFGQEWNDEVSKDWGGQAMDDILSATDAVAAEPFVDNTKLTCVGPSFGGYSVFWLAGHHEGRFKAFISHCGVFNLTSMYGATEELFFPNWEFGGPYWVKDNEDQYEDNSPHNFVEKWNTPMLIITGVNDFRVPYTQSLEAYTVLQTKGIDSRLLVFPNENHWVLGLQNAYVWQKEFFAWLDKYAK